MECKRQIREIYRYINEKLQAPIAANKFMVNIKRAVFYIKYEPKMYRKIKRLRDVKREYRRVVIKNYVILYTIDEEKSVIYIAYVYYKKSNYIDHL